MPLIEELAVTHPARVSHGWAYVPDTVQPIASMAHPNPRKRNRNDAGTTNATATAKQLKAVQSRLDDLSKENWKDGVAIPVPTRPGGKERKTKMTPNVRRILGYHKNFTHYLADEEAAIAATGTSTSSVVLPITPITAPNAAPKVDGRRKSTVKDTTTTTTTTTTAPPTPRGPGRPRKKPLPEKEAMPPPPSKKAPPTTIKQEDQPQDHPSEQSSHPTTQPPPTPKPKPPYDPSYDTNPLLRTLNLPKQPSSRILDILTTEPPLSYVAARAKPLAPQPQPDTTRAMTTQSSILKSKPPRHFCSTCGYWGKVKCRKCGEWTCGLLDCWSSHETVCMARGMY